MTASVGALERHQRRDEPEVADVEAAQQAEQRAEVQDAGERRQPGAGPLALVRQAAQDDGDRQDDEDAGRSTQTHLRSARVSRVTRCENMSLERVQRGPRAGLRGWSARIASLSKRAGLCIARGLPGRMTVSTRRPQLPVAADWFSLGG